MVVVQLAQLTVLSYPPLHIIACQVLVATGQGCCFTSSLLCPGV
jgi:hypothetical protein